MRYNYNNLQEMERIISRLYKKNRVLFMLFIHRVTIFEGYFEDAPRRGKIWVNLFTEDFAFGRPPQITSVSLKKYSHRKNI